MTTVSKHSPPWLRRGGCAHQLKWSEDTLAGRRPGGWFNLRTDLRGGWTNRPVRASQWMPSAISFDGAATPPNQGGECLLTCTDVLNSYTKFKISTELIRQDRKFAIM